MNNQMIMDKVMALPHIRDYHSDKQVEYRRNFVSENTTHGLSEEILSEWKRIVEDFQECLKEYVECDDFTEFDSVADYLTPITGPDKDGNSYYGSFIELSNYTFVVHTEGTITWYVGSEDEESDENGEDEETECVKVTSELDKETAAALEFWVMKYHSDKLNRTPYLISYGLKPQQTENGEES